MNRLQKKCLIATAGLHLLLVVILIVGPGFFRQTPKPDNTQILEFIPAIAVDTAANSGTKNAQPPPPTPAPAQPMVEPPKPVVIPTPPQPQPTPPAPAPAPTPPDTSLMDKVKDFFKPEPAAPVPTPDDSPKPAEHKKHTVNVDLTTVQRTTVEKPEKPHPHHKTDDSQQREAQQQATAVARALRAISENSSKATEVDMPGNSSASYANFGAIVVSVYHHAWRSPDNMSVATAVVRFTVTITRDGTVASAHIVNSSGDANVDDAVQRMLDRVSYIHPFPEDTKDKERTYTIDFDATRTSML